MFETPPADSPLGQSYSTWKLASCRSSGALIGSSMGSPMSPDSPFDLPMTPMESQRSLESPRPVQGSSGSHLLKGRFPLKPPPTLESQPLFKRSFSFDSRASTRSTPLAENPPLIRSHTDEDARDPVVNSHKVFERSRSLGDCPALESQASLDSLSLDESEGERSPWTGIEFGPRGSLQWRMVFWGEGKAAGPGSLLSPWHDVSLYGQDGLLNCVCKTPAGSWLRFESAWDEDLNPLRLIRQGEEEEEAGKKPVRMGSGTGDMAMTNQNAESATGDRGSKGKGDAIPAVGRLAKPDLYTENSPWNVGMLPQTWADPEQLNEWLDGVPYDNRPLEVIDIGSYTTRATGEVYTVKPLGAFATVEKSVKLAWKILAIAADDPMAEILHNVTDVEAKLAGSLQLIREWLRTCLWRKPGELETYFQLNDCATDVHAAVGVIAETHAAWQLYADQLPAVPLPPLQLTGVAAVQNGQGGQESAEIANSTLPPSKEALELAWEQFTGKESPVVVPLKGPKTPEFGTSLYTRAWEDLGDSCWEGKSLVVSPGKGKIMRKMQRASDEGQQGEKGGKAEKGGEAGRGRRTKTSAGGGSDWGLRQETKDGTARSFGQASQQSLRTKMFKIWKPKRNLMSHPAYYGSPQTKFTQQPKPLGRSKVTPLNGVPESEEMRQPLPPGSTNPGHPAPRPRGFRSVSSESKSREGFARVSTDAQVAWTKPMLERENLSAARQATEPGGAARLNEKKDVKSKGTGSEAPSSGGAKPGEEKNAKAAAARLPTPRESDGGPGAGAGKETQDRAGLAKGAAGHARGELAGGEGASGPGLEKDERTRAGTAGDVPEEHQRRAVQISVDEADGGLKQGLQGDSKVQLAAEKRLPGNGDGQQSGGKPTAYWNADLGKALPTVSADEDLYPVRPSTSSFSGEGSFEELYPSMAPPAFDWLGDKSDNPGSSSDVPLSSTGACPLEDLYPTLEHAPLPPAGSLSCRQVDAVLEIDSAAMDLSHPGAEPVPEAVSSPDSSKPAALCDSSDWSLNESSDQSGPDASSILRPRFRVKKSHTKVGGPKKLSTISADLLVESCFAEPQPPPTSSIHPALRNPSRLMANGKRSTVRLKPGSSQRVKASLKSLCNCSSANVADDGQGGVEDGAPAGGAARGKRGRPRREGRRGNGEVGEGSAASTRERSADGAGDSGSSRVASDVSSDFDSRSDSNFECDTGSDSDGDIPLAHVLIEGEGPVPQQVLPEQVASNRRPRGKGSPTKARRTRRVTWAEYVEVFTFS